MALGLLQMTLSLQSQPLQRISCSLLIAQAEVEVTSIRLTEVKGSAPPAYIIVMLIIHFNRKKKQINEKSPRHHTKWGNYLCNRT